MATSIAAAGRAAPRLTPGPGHATAEATTPPAAPVPWHPHGTWAAVDQGRLAVTYLEPKTGKHTRRVYALRTPSNGAGTWFPATLQELVKTQERWLRNPRSQQRADVVMYWPSDPTQRYWFADAYVQAMRKRDDGTYEIVPGAKLKPLSIGEPHEPVVLDIDYIPGAHSTPLAAIPTAAGTVYVPHGDKPPADRPRPTKPRPLGMAIATPERLTDDPRQSWTDAFQIGRLGVQYAGPSGKVRMTTYRLRTPDALRAITVPRRSSAEATAWAERYLQDAPGGYQPHVLFRADGRYWLTPAYTEYVDRDGSPFGGDLKLGILKASNIGAPTGPKVAGVTFDKKWPNGAVALVTGQGTFDLRAS